MNQNLKTLLMLTSVLTLHTVVDANIAPSLSRSHVYSQVEKAQLSFYAAKVRRENEKIKAPSLFRTADEIAQLNASKTKVDSKVKEVSASDILNSDCALVGSTLYANAGKKVAPFKRYELFVPSDDCDYVTVAPLEKDLNKAHFYGDASAPVQEVKKPKRLKLLGKLAKAYNPIKFLSRLTSYFVQR